MTRRRDTPQMQERDSEMKDSEPKMSLLLRVIRER